MSFKIKFSWLLLGLILFLTCSLSAQEKKIFKEEFDSDSFSSSMFKSYYDDGSTEVAWQIVSYDDLYIDGPSSPYAVSNSYPNDDQYYDYMNARLMSREWFNTNNSLYDATSEVNLNFHVRIPEGLGGDGLYAYLKDGNGNVIFEKEYDGPGESGNFYWEFKNPSIRQYIDGKEFYIEFYFYSNWVGRGEAIQLDDISLTYVPNLPKPNLTYPVNQEIIFTYENKLVFNWDKVNNAAEYDLQISTDENFNSLVLDQENIDGTQLTLDPLDDYISSKDKYYWHVRATNYKVEGDWSNYRSFEVVNEQLSASPDQLTFKPTNPKEQYSKVTSNTEWSIVDKDSWIQVSKNNYGNLIINVNEYDKTYPRTGEIILRTNSGQTTERISVTQEGIQLSVSPNPVSFQANDDYKSITITSNTNWEITNPDNDFSSITSTSGTPEIWDGSGDKSAHVYVTENPNAERRTDKFIFQTTVGDLPPVELEIHQDGASPTLTVKPTSVTLNSDGTDEKTVDVDANFSWGATTNDSWININENSDNIVISANSANPNSTRRVGQVTVGNNNYDDEPIEVIQEGSSVSLPSTPTLSSPSDGATGISLTPELVWESVSNANSYRVEVSTNADMSSPIIDALGLEGTTYTVPAEKLAYGTTYYWQVTAKNEAGEGEPSSTFSFTTLDDSTPQITVESPKEGDLWQAGSEYTISWNSSNVNGSVDIELHNSNGHVSDIAMGTSNDGSEPWAIDANRATGTDYVVKVFATGDRNVVDESGTFEIVNDSPVITVPDTPIEFGEVEVGQASVKSYTLGGSNLNGAVSVEAPTDFGLSTSSTGPFESSIDVTVSEVENDQTIYVQFNPSSAQSYNSEISHNSSGATTRMLSVSGIGTDGPTADPNEPDDTMSEATEIAYGYESETLTIDPEGDEDFFSFVASADDQIEVIAETNEVDGGIWLINSSGEIIKSIDDVWEIGTETLEYTVESAGTYYLRFAYWDNSYAKMKASDGRSNSIPSTTAINTGKYVFKLKKGGAPSPPPPPPSSITVDYIKGWNLISIPEETSGQQLSDYYSQSITTDVFEFAGNYKTVTNSVSGKAYWVKLESEETVEFDGTLIQSLTLNLEKGWNLVGTTSDTLDVSTDIQDSGGIIENGQIWKVTLNSTTGKYEMVETSQMLPGKGYFIKATASGTVTLSKQ